MGTLTYAVVPNNMVKALLAQDAGIGLGGQMPLAWQRRSWVGNGTPNASTVHQLAHAIKEGSALPSAEALGSNPELEASALKALDLIAPHRLAAVLHADDPVFLESSRGGIAAKHAACRGLGPESRSQVPCCPEQNRRNGVGVCGGAGSAT